MCESGGSSSSSVLSTLRSQGSSLRAATFSSTYSIKRSGSSVSAFTTLRALVGRPGPAYSGGLANWGTWLPAIVTKLQMVKSEQRFRLMDSEHDMRSACSCWCCALANENVRPTNGAIRRATSKMSFTWNELIIARLTDSRDQEATARRRRNR
jgi:hypothetical protein